MNLLSASYRKKNIYLAVSCVLMALLSYLLAVRRTLAIRQSVIEMETMMKGKHHVKSLQERLVMLGAQLNSDDHGGSEAEQLMENVSNLCQKKHVRLHSFPSPEVTQTAHMDVATSRFVVGGDYRNLLELLFELEKSKMTGKAVSVSFASQKALPGKQSGLELTVFWQNIRQL
nr:hypothetical protein [uncultured Dyadobacter sp.]